MTDGRGGRSVPWTGALYGLAAAVLFGASAPLAKLLLPGLGVLLLAGLLYLGAAAGLLLFGWLLRGSSSGREAALRAADAGPLVAIVALGGIAGPILLLEGLSRSSALAGSLLLNLEAPFTILLAVGLFREHLDPRGAVAALLVIGGAVVLAISPGEFRADPTGTLCIAGACLCWAVDNNLTQRISLRDPVAIVRIKTLGAGACTTSLALAAGARLPEIGGLAQALAVGSVCYGVSILFDTHALRLLGAAREAALFATAPFVGALLAIPLLGERPALSHGLAAVLMAAGVFLLLRERHAHRHEHEALEHDHLHVHDEHHRHPHSASDPPGEPHAHGHRHQPLVHDHPHVPDLHHRHTHRPARTRAVREEKP